MQTRRTETQFTGNCSACLWIPHDLCVDQDLCSYKEGQEYMHKSLPNCKDLAETVLKQARHIYEQKTLLTAWQKNVESLIDQLCRKHGPVYRKKGAKHITFFFVELV